MLKQEFRAHLDGDPQYLKIFGEKWLEYYRHITSVDSIKDLGKPLTSDELKLFTDNQKEGLEEIKKLVEEL